MIYIKNYKKIMFHKYKHMYQNTNRRNLINNYLNLIEENNSNIANIVNVMNNQETTLRRLIFETNPSQSNYTTFSNRSTFSTSRRNQRNPLNLLFIPSLRDEYIESLAGIDTLLDGFLNSVPVSPTQTQINISVENCLFSEINEPGNHACVISLRTFQENDEVSVIKYCNHIFGKNELTSWFLHNTKCPLCRYDIRNYNGVNQNNESELNNDDLNNGDLNNNGELNE